MFDFIKPGGIVGVCLCLAVFIAVSVALGNFNDGRGQVRSGSVSGNINTPFFVESTAGLIFTAETTNTTMAETITASTAWQISRIRLHLSESATTTSEDFTAVVKGTSFTLASKDTQNVKDVGFSFDSAEPFQAGETVQFAWPNTDSLTWTLEVAWVALP